MKKLVIIGIVLVSIIGIASFSYAATCNFTPKRTLEEKKEILNKKVEEGTITKEEATVIEEKLENCDETKQEKIGQEYGICFGQGQQGNSEKCMNSETCTKQGTGVQNGKKQNKQGNGTGICKKIAQ